MEEKYRSIRTLWLLLRIVIICLFRIAVFFSHHMMPLVQIIRDDYQRLSNIRFATISDKITATVLV